MKKSTIVLLLTVVLCSAASAQTVNTLSAVKFSGGSTVFSSGYLGTILTSGTSGQSWSVQPTGRFEDLLDISVYSGATGVAVGGTNINFSNGAGFLLMTHDGGNNWSYAASPNGRVLRSAKMLSSTTGIIVGGNYGSTQEGNGTILRTNDGGQNWSVITSGSTQALYSVDFADQNVGVAVGGYGTILRTDNGGLTWASVSSGTTSPLYGVSFGTTNNVTAVGRTGVILRSNDGGRTWSSQSSGFTYDLYGVDFADANLGVAVGYSGTIQRTTNGGSSWTRVSGYTMTFNGVCFRDGSVALVVGGGGTILCTANGGATWTAPSGGGGGNPPAAPTLASPASGSTNQQTSLALSWNASSGATSYQLQVATDASFNNQVVNSTTVSTSQTVGPLSNSTTYYWRVFATNAAGTSPASASWNFSTAAGVSGPTFSLDKTSINFGTAAIGIGTRDSVTVTNSGGSQLNITSVTSSDAKYVVSPTSGAVAPGSSKKFYITFTPSNKKAVNATITFTHNATGSPATVSVTGKGGSARANGKNGNVTKLDVDETANAVVLAQNYPNPFNPSTSIEYYLPEDGRVSLAVYNVLGQEVATLASGMLAGGYHSVVWDARGTDGVTLPSGIYLYRLEVTSSSTNHTSVEFGKMQLVK